MCADEQSHATEPTKSKWSGCVRSKSKSPDPFDPFEFSTGQQQRVALARTLANNPRLILADEPTGNLDPESREVVLSMFDAFVRDGRTIVMVTHDHSAAVRAARKILLRDGQIISDSNDAISRSNCA